MCSGKSRRDAVFYIRESVMKDKIVNFVNDVVKEMKKVTWPKKEELRESTGIVIIACLILAAFVYVVDRIISTIVSGIF